MPGSRDLRRVAGLPVSPVEMVIDGVTSSSAARRRRAHRLYIGRAAAGLQRQD